MWKQGIVPRRDKVYIDEGRAVHRGLEWALSGKGSTYSGVEIWSEEQRKLLQELKDDEQLTELDVISDKASDIADRAFKYLDIGHKYETVHIGGKPAVEMEIGFTDDTGFIFRGKLDWICKDLEHGFVWLWDHKLRKSLQPDENEEFNLQMVMYHYMLKEMYGDELNINGSCAFQIRNAVPSLPKVNKNGTVSRAKIATTWEVYEKFVLDKNQSPESYIEMKDKLKDIEWFRCSQSYRSQTEVDNIWYSVIVPTCTDISRNNKHTNRTINPMTCRMCRVKELCMETLRNGDIDFLMKTQFRTKDDSDKYELPVWEDDFEQDTNGMEIP